MMTVAAIIAGLLPIMLGAGTGSEVMRRIAAPMVGGMVSATILTLVLIPAVYYLWKQNEESQTYYGRVERLSLYSDIRSRRPQKKKRS